MAYGGKCRCHSKESTEMSMRGNKYPAVLHWHLHYVALMWRNRSDDRSTLMLRRRSRPWGVNVGKHKTTETTTQVRLRYSSHSHNPLYKLGKMWPRVSRMQLKQFHRHFFFFHRTNLIRLREELQVDSLPLNFAFFPPSFCVLFGL